MTLRLSRPPLRKIASAHPHWTGVAPADNGARARTANLEAVLHVGRLSYPERKTIALGESGPFGDDTVATETQVDRSASPQTTERMATLVSSAVCGEG